MRKSLVSLVIIMLVVGAAAGASYALFSDRTQVKGMTISTGNADLKIGNNDLSESEHDEINYPENDLLTDIFPGYIIGDKFRLINRSQSEISLMVEATLKKYDGDWGELRDKIYGAVIEYGGETGANNDAGDGVPGTKGTIVSNTGWQTMRWWRNNSPEIVNEPIAQDEERHFVLWLKVDENAGNEIEGKSVDLDLEFTGTQVLE